jgi:hypothetical protein
MKDGMWTRAAVVALGLTLGSTAPLFAQATRTWVSGVGDDANPCSRTAPCKTFAGAISKTATGGEINAIDPAGFGTVTITKSITIDGGGTFSSILAAGTTGVNITSSAGRVILRNLSINGIGTGVHGIRALPGSSLTSLVIENCQIENFTTTGISVEVGALVSVLDSSIRNVTATGISVAPASGTARVLLDGVRMENSGDGFLATGSTTATARNSSASGNVDAGLVADGAGVELNLHDVMASSNANGVVASNGAHVRLTDVVVTGNTTAGLLADTGGEILPFTDNQVAGNPPLGAAGCQLDAAASAVGCPAVDVDCPAPVCPAPVCEAPIMGPGLGPCRKCRTKGSVTTCSNCAVKIE